MRIGILTNDIPPGFGTPCAGVSIRTQGLLQGFKAHGIDCEILIPRQLMLERRHRWKDFSPRYTDGGTSRVFRARDWLQLCDEYDHIVLCNWASSNYVSTEHLVCARLIYDFFSPTLVEFGSSDAVKDQWRTAQDIKRQLVASSALQLANGPLIAAYADDWIAKAGINVSKPTYPVTCGLQWGGDSHKSPIFLVGGYAQLWTREVSDGWLDRLAAKFPEATFVRVGHGRHYHFGMMEAKTAESRATNIVDYDTLAYEDYLRINRIAAGLIDISQDSGERQLSVSTRAVASLSVGCPVIHNRNTWLGEAMTQAGLRTALDVDAADIEERLADNVSNLLAQRGKIDVHSFWAEHLDPSVNTADLIGAL